MIFLELFEDDQSRKYISENASKLLSAEDRNDVITVVVQAPDGTKKTFSDQNPRAVDRWLMKYGLNLPASITSKFVYEGEDLAWDDPDLVQARKFMAAKKANEKSGQKVAPAKSKQAPTHKYASKKDVKEGQDSNPVAQAITRRILSQRHDLLTKYGPVLITQAIDEVADFVGDVEEIGSSDVSGWIKQVEQMLANNPPEAFGEDLAEAPSDAIGHTAKSLENPPKVMQHRARRDQERDRNYMKTQIAKNDKTSKDEWGDLKENQGAYQGQFPTKEAAIAYAKDSVKRFRDPEDGVEIWAMPGGGFDTVATMNSSGRNHCVDNGGRKLGTVGPRYQGVAEGSGDDFYAMALQKYPQLKQVDREIVINALNNAYEDYLMHYGYEGLGPDEESSMIDHAVKGLRQGVAESNKQIDELFEPTLNYYTLSNGKKVQVSYRPNPNQSPVPFTDVTVSYVDPALKPMGPSFDSTGVAQPWTSAPDGVKQAIQKFVTKPSQGVAEDGQHRNTDYRHRVSISYADPNSTAASQRKELQQKIILVPATNKDGTTLYQGEAEELARQWARRQGWRVKEINYVELVKVKPKSVDEGWFDKKPKDFTVGQIVKYNTKDDEGTPMSGIGEITKVKPGSSYPYTINEKFAVTKDEILGVARPGEYTHQGGWPVAANKQDQKTQQSTVPNSAEMRSYFAKEKASDPADITRKMKDANKITQVYKKDGGIDEGYRVVPGIDKERYTERPGLEGPFHTKSGRVVYYDKQEGKYYDPDSDFYISHDDYQAMNEAGYVNKDSAQRGYDFSRTSFSRSQRERDRGEDENKGVFKVEIDGRPWKTGSDNEMHQLAANTKRKYPNKEIVIVWPTGQRNVVKEDTDSMPAVDRFGVPHGSKYYTPTKQKVNELTTDKLAQYKTAAAADAKRADQAGDFKRGDKRFSGMNKATMKQFSNDAKK